MGLKKAITFGFMFLLATASLTAQKTKVKGTTEKAESDSAAAAASGKAALRAGTLMKASRDSLRAGNLQAPTAVVDTFAVAPHTDQAWSPVSASDFTDARKRITDAENDLSKAAKALEKASQSGTYSDAQLEAISNRIRMQTEEIAAMTAKLNEIEQDWKRKRGPVAQPVQDSLPPTPAPKGKGSSKASVKQANPPK